MSYAKKIIGKAHGVKYLHKTHGNTNDIIDMIMYADKQCASYVIDPTPVAGRSLEETCYNIWKFFKDHVRYKEDPEGQQFVKSPGYLMEAGEGDCKSYSVAAASMLQNLGIPYAYRFISEQAGKEFHHVYVVVPSDHGEIIIDCVLDEFNRQNAFARKKDIVPQRSRAGIGAASIQQELQASTWAQHEKYFSDNKGNKISELLTLIENDINNKFPNAAVRRNKTKKALKESVNNLIRGGNVLFYLYWDTNLQPFDTSIVNQLSGVQISSKRQPGEDYRDMLLDLGLSLNTIKQIAKLGCFNTYGITLEYMLYRCYNMVAYGQPWEPAPGIPYYNFRTGVLVNQLGTPESFVQAYQIAMCFPAIGGIARPFGEPYLAKGGWFIKNGASDADFETWKKYKVFSPAEQELINNALPEEEFADCYATYLLWLKGNLAALPNIAKLGANKIGVSGAHIGDGGLGVTAIVGIVVACVTALSAIAALIRNIIMWTKDVPAGPLVPNPPQDFNMEYQSVDGCYIGTAPAECGPGPAKYCPDGTFICLTPQDMSRPENQPGTPADGFLGIGAPKLLLFGGLALLLLALFSSSSKSSAA